MDYSVDLSSQKDLRFLVFGLGAIGTYVGGSLLLSGQQVVFIGREESTEQARNQGIRLEIAGEKLVLPSPVVFKCLEAALQSRRYDVAIIAVKSYDTLGLAQAISRSNADFPAILSLQNGVENERLLATHLGQEHVIAGTITSAVRRISAGDVILERPRGVGIDSGHPLSETLITAFNRAGLNVRLYDNAQSMKWSKLLTNLVANASSAILDMTPAEIFSNPDLYAIERSQIREALAVMEALNLPVTDLPGAPVRMLTFAMQSLPLKLSQPIVRRVIGRARGGKMPSFHIDLHAGKAKTEVDYLNGAVVRFADQLGIPAPVNRVLNNTLQAMLDGKIAIQDFSRQPEKLLNLIEQTNS